MSWKDFCERNQIGKYRNASIENLIIPADAKGTTFLDKALRFLKDPKPLFLTGGCGRGKTHFLFSLIRGLLEEKKIPIGDVRFFRTIDLDGQMVQNFEKYKSCEYLISTLSEVKYLFLDDFGLERASEKAEKDYYNLIDKRIMNENVTIYSSNIEPDALKDYYGQRIASRLKECAIIRFEGPDLRNLHAF